jgi:uncharacterized protein YggE
VKKRLLIAVISVALLAVIGLGLVSFLPGGAAAADTTTPVNVNINGQQGIWVNGQGQVTAVPNIAIANLGVSAQASTVADALAQASAAMDKIKAALAANGIDPKDIQTSYFNIQQIINNNVKQNIFPTPTPLPPSGSGSASGSSGAVIIPATPEPPTENAFRVDNTVTVKIRAIDQVGTIIDAVAAAGGDLTRVNGVSFSVENPDQYYVQARQAAMKDAQAKAQQLAQLSGVTLGKAFYISENSYPQPIYYPGAAASYAMDSSGGTSLSPGQTVVILNVQVAYVIQ